MHEQPLNGLTANFTFNYVIFAISYNVEKAFVLRKYDVSKWYQGKSI